MQRRIAHGLAIGFLIVGLGAAQGPNISEAKSAPLSSLDLPQARQLIAKSKPYQVGTASWYGQNFEGKPTASGEPYEMYDMTAAHLKLPMGSYVRVTNLRNGRSVIVRVNDRGPIVPGRIIDLSCPGLANPAAWAAKSASGSGHPSSAQTCLSDGRS